MEVGEAVVDERIAQDLTAILAAAADDGIVLRGWSRHPIAWDLDRRRRFCGPTAYDVWEKPANECSTRIPIPSVLDDHNQGLAIDFAETFRDKPSHDWLKANAADFGFLPNRSEPWHWVSEVFEGDIALTRP